MWKLETAVLLPVCSFQTNIKAHLYNTHMKYTVMAYNVEWTAYDGLQHNNAA